MTAPFKPVAPQPADDKEQQIRQGIDETLKDLVTDEEKKTLIGILMEATKTTKKVVIRDPCPKCDCKHVRYAEITDSREALKAIEMVFNRIGGRPGQASQDDAGVVVTLQMVGMEE